jgi:hypothetical protein
MKKLEDYIHNNREQFEDSIPAKLHEEKFIRLLNNQQSVVQANRFSTINNWLKVAAIAIALVGLGIGIIAIVGRPVSVLQNADSNLPPELVEMEQYYTNLTHKKIDQIEKLAGSGSEAGKVKASLDEEIKNLNANSESLKKEYIKGNNDERLVDAIKNNYRILSGLLDKVVEQLSKPEPESSETNKLSNSNYQRYEIKNA